MHARLLRALFLAILCTPAWAGHGTPLAVPSGPDAGTATIAVTGYVDEIVVQDLARQATHTFQVLVADDGTRYLLRGAAAQALVTGATVDVRGKPARDTLFADSVDVLGSADPRRQAAASRAAVTVAGTMRLGHWDNFDGGPSRFFFSVFDGKGHVDVKLATELGVLDNGMQVSTTGRVEADGELVPESIVIESGPTQPTVMALPDAVAAAVTNQTLVIPIKFKDSMGVFPADPFTIAQINNAVFAATTSVAEYYREASYGQQLLAGTVANRAGAWLEASVAAPTPAACNTSLIASEADAAATAQGFNLASYQNVVYLFARTGFSCGWAGLAYVGYGRAWINQTTSVLVFGHELGHNFGLLHAGGLDCGANVIGGTCTVSEYGDPFGLMGNNRAMHFNAMQKRVLNWIPSSSTPTHASGSQTYTISPLETGSGALYAIRIPAAARRTYWVEFRQPIGFDAGLSSFPNNGAQVRVATPFETVAGSDDTQFLDMTPATSASTDGALLAGSSYSDATYGVTINVLTASPSALTVQVVKTGLYGSATTLTSSRNPATAGQSVTFTANVSGLAPTGSVGFTDGGSPIAGCTAQSLSGTGDTRTATCTTAALGAGTHAIVANYTGDAGNAASSSTALTQTINGTGSTPTSTTLASSRNPSTAGQLVTFTATISGGSVSGTVAFRDGGATIAGCASVAVSTGVTRTAACSTSALGAGARSITAAYSGDANFAPSTSAALAQTVSAGASSTTLASSANPSGAGQSVTFTASVTGFSPTGSVAFRDGGTAIPGCSAVALSASGSPRTASCTTSGLALGTHAVTAVYGGDTNNAGSTSASLVQTIVGARTGDFNLDGRADVFWHSATTGNVAVLLMNGTAPGAWTSAGTAPLGWKIEGVGDFNGDGKADLLWRETTTGQVAIWLSNGSPWTGAIVGAPATRWSIVGIGDFDGDGRSDILWRDTADGTVGLWLMSGTTFRWAPIGGTGLSWVVAGTGDFNADGRSDVLWRDSASGVVGIWTMNGATPTWAPIGFVSPGWNVEAVADFNADGRADILWRETGTGSVGLYLMNGASATWAPVGPTSTAWSVAAVGDYNGDGNADILWRERSTGNIGVFLMNGASAAWTSLGSVGTGWNAIK